MNHLFGCDIAKTSDSRSETRTTSEYLIKKDAPEWGTKDLSLAIIDTPGFNDSDGSIKQVMLVPKVIEYSHYYFCSTFRMPSTLHPLTGC